MDYQKLYFHLVGQISDIIDSIDLLGDPPEKIVEYVRQWLIDTLQEAEEIYLQETDELYMGENEENILLDVEEEKVEYIQVPVIKVPQLSDLEKYRAEGSRTNTTWLGEEAARNTRILERQPRVISHEQQMRFSQ